MSAKKAEAIFSKFVKSRLEDLLTHKKGLKIKADQSILTDVTCDYKGFLPRLIHGFAKVDVAIYFERAFDKGVLNSDLIHFYNDSYSKEGKIAIPLVILELKTGKLTTDGIRSRDIVAQKIKRIFPLSAYYFIAQKTNKSDMTLIRQGGNFTGFFIYKDEMEIEDLEMIVKKHIQPYIKNLKEQINKLASS